MDKLIGYMVTWSTYGTWLQGDKRRYSSDCQILPPDKDLEDTNIKQQKSDTVRLTGAQKKIVEDTILQEARRIGHRILALAVCSNHIHLAAGLGDEPIESAVSRYKNVSTAALKKTGLTKRIWTRGFNKRFCFNLDHLNKIVDYVNHHNNSV